MKIVKCSTNRETVIPPLLQRGQSLGHFLKKKRVGNGAGRKEDGWTFLGNRGSRSDTRYLLGNSSEL